MFETLFTYPRVLRRHLEGPLAEERAAYLTDLAARGVAQTTLVKQARCSLRVAVELETWPCGHCFDDGEVRAMASRYADRCRAASSRDAEGHFRATATDLLRRLGRLRPPRPRMPPRYEGMVRAFIAEQRGRGWLSDATCRSAEVAGGDVPRPHRGTGHCPGGGPRRRHRRLPAAHGVALEPPFAEHVRRLPARMAAPLRGAGTRAARSGAGRARAAHPPSRGAADGSAVADRRAHARGDRRRRSGVDQGPRGHPAAVGLRRAFRRGPAAAPRRHRLASRPDPLRPLQERPPRAGAARAPGRERDRAPPAGGTAAVFQPNRVPGAAPAVRAAVAERDCTPRSSAASPPESDRRRGADRTVCDTPAPGTCWSRDRASRRSATTSGTATPMPPASTPR